MIHLVMCLSCFYIVIQILGTPRRVPRYSFNAFNRFQVPVYRVTQLYIWEIVFDKTTGRYWQRLQSSC